MLVTMIKCKEGRKRKRGIDTKLSYDFKSDLINKNGITKSIISNSTVKSRKISRDNNTSSIISNDGRNCELLIEDLRLKRYEKLLGIDSLAGEKLFREDGLDDLLDSIVSIESNLGETGQRIQSLSKERKQIKENENHVSLSDIDGGCSDQQDDEESESESTQIESNNIDSENKPENKHKEVALPLTSSYVDLKKRIKGILNRYTPVNLEQTLELLEEIFQSNPRRECIVELVSKDIPYVLQAAYSALVHGLYTVVGSDIAIGIVYSIASKLCSALSCVTDGSERNELIIALYSFIPSLYNFKVVSSTFIYDLLAYQDNLNELALDCIITTLKLCGYQIRTDNPARFKLLTQTIQEKFSTGPQEKKRFEWFLNIKQEHEFLVKSLVALKNGKKDGPKMSTISYNETDCKEKLLTTLNTFFKRRKIQSTQCLPYDLREILSTEGSQIWSLIESNTTQFFPKPTIDSSFNVTSSKIERIKQLATKHRMNTDIRKAIFTTLVASEDFSSVFENMLKLNLKDKQEREILKVVVYCALKEKEFNPFYALVASKFCSYKNSFKVTAKYVLWDYIKKMECCNEDDKLSTAKIVILAKLYSFLYSGCNISLGILSCLQFVSLSDEQQLFLKILFCTLFTSFFKTVKEAQSFISKVKHKATNEGLALFFKAWKKDKYIISIYSTHPSTELLRIYDTVCSTFLSLGENTLF